MKDMTSGSPLRLIVRFAIPILLGNLFQQTYSIADTRIIGTFLGDEALAAVGATSVLSSLFTGFFMGLANGFAIMTAQRYGAKQMRDVKISFAASLLWGILLSAGIISVSLLCLHPILHFLNVPDSLFTVSAGYIRIILAGMLITMLYDVLLAASRALGDSITPLLTLILSVILNIIGDMVLLGYFHTGVQGAAAATVGSQCITLAICAVYLIRRYPVFRLKPGDFHEISRSMSLNMLATGLSMGFMNSLIGIGSLVLQTAVNSLGNSYIVAQSTARKITNVLMSVFVAFGNAMATYCSQNFGAGKKDRIRQGIRSGLQVTCSWCVIVLLIAWIFSPTLVRMFTGSSDAVMIRAASDYLKFDTILYFLVAIIFVLRHSLQGVGDRITPLISSGIEMVGKIILTFTLVPYFKYTGVILVEPIVWIVMVIPLIDRIRKWQK